MSKYTKRADKFFINIRENNGIRERRCTQCGDWKVESEEFYLNNKSKPEKGYQAACKKCTSKSARARTLRHPEMIPVYRKRHNQKPERKAKQREIFKIRRALGKQQKWLEEHPINSKKYNLNRILKNHIITDTEWIACKDYFKDEDGDWACIYCGLKAKDHYKNYKGQPKLYDLEKDHVDNYGSPDLDNCISSCWHCNDAKHTTPLNEWYNPNNPKFEQWRYDKIIKWLTEDYKQYIEEKKPKGKYTRKNKN